MYLLWKGLRREPWEKEMSLEREDVYLVIRERRHLILKNKE